MERICTDEVVRAMQHVGWGEYTQPMSRARVAVTKSLKINATTPKSSQCKLRPTSIQGVTYSDGKKIIGYDLGIVHFNTVANVGKKFAELRREDMRT